MRFLGRIIKRFIVGAFLLYGYNLIAVNFNMIIPINIFTIAGVTLLGVPAMIGFIIFKVFIL